MTRLTTNSQETTLGDLLSIGTSLYLIPFFQREYRWAPDKVANLIQDILNIVDGLNDKHFLGAIIVHGRRANPTDPKVFEVIDGQQRLTTAFLFIAAVVKVLSSHGQYDEAARLAQNYLQIGRDYRKSNLRIHSSRLDRAMMSAVVDDLKSEEQLVAALKPYEFNPLPVYGSVRGVIRNNYNRFKRFFNDEINEGGLSRLRQIYEIFLNNFTVVQIDVLDPTDGPKIFDSLNSKQEPMKISDLVRNEIFRKVSDESPELVERIDEEVWQPFYASFERNGQNTFDKFLFPLALVADPNLRKSDVFLNLRTQWNDVASPQDIISSMEAYKGPYLDTIWGTNISGFPDALAKVFYRLASSGAPTSILPFTMRLGREVIDQRLAPHVGVEILSVVESFLVRRAVCGYEPTGLHAVFKRLWQDLNNDVTRANVISTIASHKTVSWPADEEFAKAVENRPLYGSSVTRYFLMEYDRSLGGDAHAVVETIEHVLPQSSDSEWKSLYGAGSVDSDLNALANLLPCTGSMNTSLSNQSYKEKRLRFMSDSKYKATRDFGAKYEVWNSENFRIRAREISAWALERWPYFVE